MSSWSVIFTKEAEEDLSGLDGRIQPRVLEKITYALARILTRFLTRLLDMSGRDFLK